MTDFEKRVGAASEVHSREFDNEADKSWAVYSFEKGARWANADREAYAAERVREERERILGMLRSPLAGETKERPFGMDYATADDWADWLETRLKAEAGKGKNVES